VSGMTAAPKENVAALSVLAAGDASATGISAFAFQGSNAHVILGIVDSEAAHVVSERANWSREWSYVNPRAHPLCTLAILNSKGKKLSVHALLRHTVLSYLWDHRINGRALVPGTLGMEISSTMGHTMSDGILSSSRVCVVGVSVRLPSRLPDAETGSSGAYALALSFDMAASEYELHTLRSHESRVHASGRISRLSLAVPSTATALRLSEHVEGSVKELLVQNAYLRTSGYVCGSIDVGLTQSDSDGYRSHPAALDAAQHFVSSARSNKPSMLSIADSYVALGRTCGRSRLLARIVPGALPGGDVSLRGSQFTVCAATDLRGLKSRTLMQQMDAASATKARRTQPTVIPAAAEIQEVASLRMGDVASSGLEELQPEGQEVGPAEVSAERRELLLHQAGGIDVVIELLAIDGSDADDSDDEETVLSYQEMLRGVYESMQASVPAVPAARDAPEVAPSGSRALRRDSMLALVRNRVLTVLRQTVDDDVPLTDVGLDSLAGNELRVQLAQGVGVVMLPTELVFNYPTIEALAGFLVDGLKVDAAPERETRSPAIRAAALQSQLLQIVSSVLGQEVTSDEPLVNAGMDSISANELRSQLARAVGVAMLPPEVVFDYPNVDALANYLQEFLDDAALLPGIASTAAVAPQQQLSAAPVHGFDAFASSLKEMLAEALVLEGEWPEMYDDVPLGELGVSPDIIQLVHEHFRVDMQLTEVDTLTEILLRARVLLPE